jgi:hypothetical protein
MAFDKILTNLRNWIEEHHKITTKIENNILQKDNSAKFEEKVMSIGISSFLVYIGTSLLGLFGVATGGIVVGVVLFAIGWFLSRFVNKKIFGVQRDIEDITTQEQQLLGILNDIDERYKIMSLQIRFKKIIANFTDYVLFKNNQKNLVRQLSNYDTSNLAYKYRFNHSLIAKKYEKLTIQFDKLYANKKGA